MIQSNEACDARFDEIDITNNQWVISVERMKKKTPYRLFKFSTFRATGKNQAQ